MAKKIKFIRHGFKTADGKHITPECLQDIRENGIPGVGIEVNRLHEGSDCIRTFETGEAFVDWVNANGGEVNESYIARDPRFGSDELFSKMVTPEFKAMRKETGKGNFEVLKSTASFKNFNNWMIDLGTALMDVFNQLQEGDICLLPSHSPIVEMLVNEVLGGNLVDLNTKELQGVTFVQSDDIISVTDISI